MASYCILSLHPAPYGTIRSWVPPLRFIEHADLRYIALRRTLLNRQGCRTTDLCSNTAQPWLHLRTLLYYFTEFVVFQSFASLSSHTFTAKVGACSISEGFSNHQHPAEICNGPHKSRPRSLHPIFSCLNFDYRSYDVHVLASREGPINQTVRIIQNSNINTREIVVVLVSYGSRQWNLEIDSRLTISTIALVSFQ